MQRLHMSQSHPGTAQEHFYNAILTTAALERGSCRIGSGSFFRGNGSLLGTDATTRSDRERSSAIEMAGVECGRSRSLRTMIRRWAMARRRAASSSGPGSWDSQGLSASLREPLSDALDVHTGSAVPPRLLVETGFTRFRSAVEGDLHSGLCISSDPSRSIRAVATRPGFVGDEGTKASTSRTLRKESPLRTSVNPTNKRSACSTHAFSSASNADLFICLPQISRTV